MTCSWRCRPGGSRDSREVNGFSEDPALSACGASASRAKQPAVWHQAIRHTINSSKTHYIN
eukprot:16251596-Heterocapsa_arctica.AAC.1